MWSSKAKSNGLARSISFLPMSLNSIAGSCVLGFIFSKVEASSKPGAFHIKG